MRNICLLPTESETRLYLSDYGKVLNLGGNPKRFYTTGQHIYITSDEEIKEGDWGLSKLNEIILFGRSYNEKFYKKIILTTDQDLIKNGVHPIFNEFLEWFVKNPSYEEVEVQKYHGINTSIAEINAISGNGSLNWQGKNDLRDYKIIIPKEEPIQSTKDRILSETSDEIKQKVRETANDLVNKQETLEEFIESYVNRIDRSEDGLVEQCLESGAKWQQERCNQEFSLFLMELKDRIDSFEYYVNQNSHIQGSINNWIEQHKK